MTRTAGRRGASPPTFALISACTELGCACLLGCMVESGLGIAAGLQLAGRADYVGLDGALLLVRDPFAGLAVDWDLLTATDEPGLGVRPSDERAGRELDGRAGGY